MGTIRLSSDAGTGSSILSNTFIDYYMPEANGDFVKIYLYLLRLQQSNRQISSLSEIADHLNCTDKDVKRAIKYWISKGVLQYRYDDSMHPAGIVLCQPKNPEITPDAPRIVDYLRVVRSEEQEDRNAPLSGSMAEEIAASRDMTPESQEEALDAVLSAGTSRAKTGTSRSASAGKKTRTLVQPSPKELAEALVDENFKDLTVQAEAFFDRPLSQKDINALWVVYKDLALPFEVCEYLLEYCGQEREDHPERTEPDYYKKIATTWAEYGVHTKEEAKSATARHFFGTQILRALGIRDRYMPTEDERRMFEDWQTRYGFSEEMLILACETALRRKPRSVSYSYIQGILEDWHKQGYKTPQDIEQFDRKSPSRKTRTPENPQSDFIQGSLSDDLDLIEQLSIKKAKES